MHPPFIRRCLELAEQGRGKTGTNPMVGAVLVRDGKILAEGFHAEYGKAHAERHLLEFVILSLPKNDQKISSNDTLYVNLEPCCHSEKKTPPCVNLIIEKGIKHIVYGMRDPNPQVSGKGIEYLIKKDVQVSGPVLEQECRRLNRGFVSLMSKDRPWITLKSAFAADRSIANSDGSPKRITSKQQDEWSHRFLRGKHDAILVGIGTVIADDPELTVRIGFPSPSSRGERSEPRPGGGVRGWGPWRVILDPSLKIPLTAIVVGPWTIVVTAPGADALKKRLLESKGVRTVEVPLISGSFDWSELWKVLTTPQKNFHGISSILVEGGARTWEIFRQAKMIDEEVTLVGL